MGEGWGHMSLLHGDHAEQGLYNTFGIPKLLQATVGVEDDMDQIT